MLWNAGQERQEREQRTRLAESFVATHDALLDAVVDIGLAKPIGAWRKPAYARSEAPAPIRNPALRDMALAKLNAQFPGMVKGRPS